MRTAVLALAVAAVMTAACGGGGLADEPTVLRVLMADDWFDTAPVVDAVRTFEQAHPGVQIQIRGLPFSQIPDEVEAAVEGGAEPFDVAHWHAFAAASRDLAEPLDDLWEDGLDAGAFVPGAVEDVTWDGRRYGVPLDVNAMVLVVNDADAAAAGVDLDAPVTFADVRRIAAAATTPDGTRRGIALAHSSWATYGWVRAYGGEVVQVGDDGTARVTLDAPEVVAALDFLGSLVASGRAFPPDTVNGGAESFALFRSGAAAMHATGSWDLAALERSQVPWTPRTVGLPRATTARAAGTALGGSSLFVPAGSGNRELAFEFMTHLIEDGTALRLAEEEGRLPARRRLFDDPVFDDPAYRPVVEQLEVATPMRLIAFPAADRAFSVAIQEVLAGRQDAAAALAQAQRRATAAGTA